MVIQSKSRKEGEKVKKVVFIALAVILVVAMVPIAAFAAKPGTDFNGFHQTLNLIGKDKDMPGDYNNPDRGTMFVPKDTAGLKFTNPDDPLSPEFAGIKISITQSTEFAVIDGNATDGFGAFQLGPGKYSCYIAVKAKYAKASGIVDITGWVQAYDNAGGLWYYLNVGVVSVSKAKNSSYTDATGLFFVDTTEDTFGLLAGLEANYIPGLGMWVFDYMNGLDSFAGINPSTGVAYNLSDLAYFWQLQNDGAKLIQVRFYPMN
jgi:hypothetical protein